jgi:hypothetical protein
MDAGRGTDLRRSQRWGRVQPVGLVATLLASIVVSSCVGSLQSPPDVAAGTPTARIFVLVTASVYAEVVLDEEPIARIAEGEFTHFDVPAGTHRLGIQPAVRLILDPSEYSLPEVDIEARAGRSYYFEVTKPLGLYRLNGMSSAAGSRALLTRTYKPAGPSR